MTLRGGPSTAYAGGDRGPHFPPPEPGRHGWAELLTLVGAIRRIAYDLTMQPDDQMRRIRDLFLDHPGAARDA